MSRTLYNTYERLLRLIDQIWAQYICEPDPLLKAKLKHELDQLEADRELIENALERMEKKELQVIRRMYALQQENRNLIREMEGVFTRGN